MTQQFEGNRGLHRLRVNDVTHLVINMHYVYVVFVYVGGGLYTRRTSHQHDDTQIKLVSVSQNTSFVGPRAQPRLHR